MDNEQAHLLALCEQRAGLGKRSLMSSCDRKTPEFSAPNLPAKPYGTRHGKDDDKERETEERSPTPSSREGYAATPLNLERLVAGRQKDAIAGTLGIQVKVSLKALDEGLVLPRDEGAADACGVEIRRLEHDLDRRVAIGFGDRIVQWCIAEVELSGAPGFHAG